MIDVFNQQKMGVIVKFHGPTKTQVARVSLTHAKTGMRKMVEYDPKYDYFYDQADEILKAEKIRVMYLVHMKSEVMLVCHHKNFGEFWKK